MNQRSSRLKTRIYGPVLALVLVVPTLSLWGARATTDDGKTLANLVVAFNGESNAHARYQAFAAKAEEEGYGEVASLFRAAARAEKIHADNHAVVIRSMGGAAKAQVERPEVGTTAENLEAAIAGESYERDTMYPDFIRQARADGNRDALRSFNYAISAEREHAKLYEDALGRLESLKGSSSRIYYVCNVCGYTTTRLDFSKCPSCFNPVDDVYVEVS